MNNVAAILVLLSPTAAFGQQPFSTSMAECAALTQNLAQWVTSDEAAEKLMYATNQWANAAVEQAASEGVEDARETIWDMIDQKTEAWEAKGEALFANQEYYDWLAYCKSFRKSRGIKVAR